MLSPCFIPLAHSYFYCETENVFPPSRYKCYNLIIIQS